MKRYLVNSLIIMVLLASSYLPAHNSTSSNTQANALPSNWKVLDTEAKIDWLIEHMTLEEKIDFMWEMRSPAIEEIGTGNLAVLYDGVFVPPITGTYTFRFSAKDSGFLFVDEKKVIENTKKNNIGRFDLVAGEPVSFYAGMTETTGDAAARLKYALPIIEAAFSASMKKLEARVTTADLVIFVGGVNHSLENEGRDRADIKFLEIQAQLINAVSKMCPKTAVVLYKGAPLEVGTWIDSPVAVLEAWYAGIERGSATGRLLFGDANPSGKLPFAWPNTLLKSPAHDVGTQDYDRIEFKEGIYVGYRYHNQQNLNPQFPFGYGLSYPNYAYEKLKVKKSSDTKYPVVATITLKNTGKVEGKEIIPIYASDLKSSIDQPVKELAGFVKVSLEPNESKTVEISLNWTAFQFFNVYKKEWLQEPGNSKSLRAVRPMLYHYHKT